MCYTLSIISDLKTLAKQRHENGESDTKKKKERKIFILFGL
jgi:hypothetical protein